MSSQELPQDGQFGIVPAGRQDQVQQRVLVVLAALEAERAGRNYYDMIDPNDRKSFDGLVESNMPYYPQMRPEAVREMFAKNYLARIKAFEGVVTGMGFKEVSELGSAPADAVALTRSASYVFMGLGVFTAEGGPFTYFKIEGRRTGGKQPFSDAVRVTGEVRVGAKVNVIGHSIANTSNLRRLFVRPAHDHASDGASIIDVSVAVRSATDLVNERTMMIGSGQPKGLPEKGE
jgi:hypothetical protein